MKILNLMGLVCLLLAATGAFAQPTTSFRSDEPKFGNASDGSITVSTTTYTDNTRAAVTSISLDNTYSSSTWPYEYTIEHDAAHGSWGSLNTDDVVLLFQGEQDPCTYKKELSKAAHCFAYVTSSTSTDVTVRTSIKLTNTLIPETITSSDKVQIILVPQYDDVTLNTDAELTCSAWDGETGGIVCLLVDGILDFNASGVVIDVSEKGFKNGKRDNNTSSNNTALPSATPGSVSMKDATGGGGTLVSNWISPTFRVDYGSGCVEEASPRGGYGTYMELPARATPQKTEHEEGCWTDETNWFNLGSGGKEGQPGPYGAASGGAGGAGAKNSAGNGAGATGGTNGTAGSSGSGSGYGGKGGRGGGAIFIYARSYDYNSTITPGDIFLVDGGNAEFGEDGDGIGGDGGDGGSGANGNCNPGIGYDEPGAGGYPGQAGLGAFGGGGGSAGHPGYVRFFSDTYNDQQFSGSVVVATIGTRGYGGAGDDYGTNGLVGSVGAENLGTCIKCYEIQENRTEYCDCNDALANIAKAAENDPGILDNTATTIYSDYLNINFGNTPGDWKMEAIWDDQEFLRVTTYEVDQAGSGSQPKIINVDVFNCAIEDASVRIEVFDHLKNNISNSGDWVSDFSNGITKFTGYQFDNAEEEYQTSVGGVVVGEEVGCPEISFDGPTSPGNDGPGGLGALPSGGDPGNDYRRGDFYSSTGATNSIFVNGVNPVPPLFVEQLEISKEIKAYPNPANSQLTLVSSDLSFEGVKNVTIYDTRGKIVASPSFQIREEELVITELNQLPTGTYFVKLYLGSNSYLVKLLRE